MKTEDYESQMLQHLNQHGRQIDIPTLNQALQNADSLLLQLQDDLSPTEFRFLSEKLDSKAIPTPKLAVKDHKKPSKDTGIYLARLIAPGQNFISGFPQMGYIAIKKSLRRINATTQNS